MGFCGFNTICGGNKVQPRAAVTSADTPRTATTERGPPLNIQHSRSKAPYNIRAPRADETIQDSNQDTSIKAHQQFSIADGFTGEKDIDCRCPATNNNGNRQHKPDELHEARWPLGIMSPLTLTTRAFGLEIDDRRANNIPRTQHCAVRACDFSNTQSHSRQQVAYQPVTAFGENRLYKGNPAPRTPAIIQEQPVKSDDHDFPQHTRQPLVVCLWLMLFCFAQSFVVNAAELPFDHQVQWREVFRGVAIASLEASSPRPIRAYAVRIQLDAKGVNFLATPGNGDLPGETTGVKTSTFLKTHGLQVAINAGPFWPVEHFENRPQDVVGAHVSRGRLVSPWDEKLPALLITRSNRVIIAEPPLDLAGVENAVGGFAIVLRGGRVVQGDGSLHPRTAAGVSADGKTLVLLTIDGRQTGYSEGATTAEVGQWLKALGCSEGINLDGGGSTTLVIQDQQGRPRVLNRPIHAGIPGMERVVGSHLGIYAEKLQ